MTTVVGDVRYALRMLIKTPVLSLAAIITIALGVGITTHTFSTVYGSILRGLDFEGETRLISVSRAVPADGIAGAQVPILDVEDWQERQTAFQDLATFRWTTVNLADDEGRPEQYSSAAVSANLFTEVLAKPLLGRVFLPEEDAGHAPPTIILSSEVWQTRYGGDPDIIGRTIRANGVSVTVVGVMPEGFHFPFDQRVWLPLGIDPLESERGGDRVQVVGRLNPGVSLEQATTQMDGIAARLASEYPDTNDGVTVWVQPYEDYIMPPAIVAVMWVMLASVFGVLMIACFNVANLLLARAVSRSKETAIRAAMGASRAQIVRQLLMESAVLASLGGIGGVVLATVMMNSFNARLIDIQKPYWIDVRLDAPALLFALGVTILAALLAGTVPALKASGTHVNAILKDESRGSTGMRLGRFSTGLVIGEIALSCALLVGAGMMIKSVVNLKTLDMGFDAAPVMTARLGLPETDYPDQVSSQQFFDILLEELRALPGVQSAGLTNSLPALGSQRVWLGIDGVAYQSDQDFPIANRAFITSGFFETFGVPMLEGRDFTVQDREGALRTVVINRSFATKHFGQESPVGRRFRLGRLDSDQPVLTIIGVVPDLHVGGGVGGLGSDRVTPEQFYLPIRQSFLRSVSLAVRTTGDPAALAPFLRSTVAGIDPNLPLSQVATMSEAIETATWSFGLFGSLFATFGIAALFLAAVGLYGVMAFSVGRRTQEMGVRMVLGASTGSVRRMVLGQGMRQLGIGGLIGLAMGAAMARPMSVVFFDVNPSDPSVYLAIALTLGVAGLVACIVPAWRATRVELVDALRPE